MSGINYSEKIPNNVNLTTDRTLQRALEHWQPKFLDWWHEMGPTDFETANVYLRTAISVDPKRDNLQLLKNYALYFNADFTGITGSVEALRALTAPLGMDFSYGKPDKQGNYGVTHSTAVILVDPEGEETALYTPPLDAKRMAADYVNIIRYYGEQW